MIKNNLVLDVPPGIGLFGLAFEKEGYCLVMGPDLLWGRDMRDWHPPKGTFEGIIGGPPCQEFSRMRHMLEATGKLPRFGNLIPEFERIIYEAQPDWFVMENVSDAPIPVVSGYTVHDYLLNNRFFGGVAHRVRRFSFGSPQGYELQFEVVAFEALEWQYAVTSDGRQIPVKYLKGGKPKRVTVLAADTPTPGQRRGGTNYRTLEENCLLQGLPPDFTKYMPFLKSAKYEIIGNGVPLLMGRAVAKAVGQAILTGAGK